MGKKIFVSYKYSDAKVRQLAGYYPTTARHYVNMLENLLEEGDHIYKGEGDGESLSSFKDSTIQTKLKNKIYDSSVTIVLISKGMRDPYTSEDDQWIPWEISYSLKEMERFERVSKTNAVLAVMLPDENGSYEYLVTYDTFCGCNSYNTPSLFKILRDNMFNQKNPTTSICNGSTIYYGESSYIHFVKWAEFVQDIDRYINIAISIKNNKDNYNVKKTVS